MSGRSPNTYCNEDKVYSVKILCDANNGLYIASIIYNCDSKTASRNDYGKHTDNTIQPEGVRIFV